MKLYTAFDYRYKHDQNQRSFDSILMNGRHDVQSGRQERFNVRFTLKRARFARCECV